MHRHNFKIFSRTTGLIFIKFDVNHIWLTGISICSHKEQRPFQRGDNNKIAKIHWWTLKIFFSRTTRSNPTKFCILWWFFKRKIIPKIHRGNFKKSSSHDQLGQCQLVTKHFWLFGIQVSQMKVHALFIRENKNKMKNNKSRATHLFNG